MKTMNEVIREHLLHVLKFTGFNVTRTGEILGWRRKRVNAWINKFNIHRPQSKPSRVNMILQCEKCGYEWSPSIGKDGELPPDLLKCPHGCKIRE